MSVPAYDPRRTSFGALCLHGGGAIGAARGHLRLPPASVAPAGGCGNRTAIHSPATKATSSVDLAGSEEPRRRVWLRP